MVRAAKPGGNNEKSLMAKWNVFMPARNALQYAEPRASAIPILLLVYERTSYLEPALRLYGRVRGINGKAGIVPGIADLRGFMGPSEAAPPLHTELMAGSLEAKLP